MNEQLKKQLNTYKRSLENKRMQVSIHTLLLVVIVVFYGFVGTYLLIKVTRERLTAMSDLTRLVVDLTIKKGNIEEMKQKLAKTEFYIERVNLAVPKETMLEDFMIDLVNVASRNGFKQKRLYRRSFDENTLELNVTLQGANAQVPSLIEAIESMDRLVTIERFSLRTIEETATVSLVLSIYYLEK